MAKNTSIALGEHFNEFVSRQLKDGRYGSASEVVRAGLRMLEEHEARVEALRSALIEGEQSGPAKKFEAKKFLVSVKKKHAEG
ncbi:MAG: type II toxin-antitoxin system ParD family antitoxin [Nitrospinota bacterium]|nr:type II toxin-antitoxin system ParD family antitoxin [Nitrospinota bacterium]